MKPPQVDGQNPTITARGLTRLFGDFAAIQDLDLDVYSGEIFGLLGPNGSGKTTTLECLVGLQEPTSGTVSVLGLNPLRDRRAFTSRVAVQPQTATLFESLTVVETLTLFASFHARPLPVGEVLRRVNLGGQATVQTRHLSGGQHRQLLVAVAMIGDPAVMVLDEPSAGLDPAARHRLVGIIRELSARGCTVLLTTHQMEEASLLCDRIAVIVAGRLIAQGSPEQLATAYGGRSTVSFVVPEPEHAGHVHAIAEGAEVTISDHGTSVGVRVETNNPDEFIRRATFDRALRARSFSVHHGTLEEAFLKLATVQEGESGTQTVRSWDSP